MHMHFNNSQKQCFLVYFNCHELLLITHNRAYLLQAKELLEGNKLSSFVDSRLRDNYVIAELEEMVKIALLCTMYNPDQRPSMAEIAGMLQESDGSVVEKWETLKDAERSKPSTPEFMLSSPVNFASDECNSIQLEAVELSGPR